ncbi:MAG: DUF1295 domain-containing protein [Myxococcota bacterium]
MADARGQSGSKTGSAIFDHVWAFNDWFMHRIPLGPAVCQPRQAINLHKVSVGPFVLGLMLAYDQWSLAAWLYLALHGTYGLLWVAKDIAFGDRSWKGRATVGSAVGVFIFPLALYYLPALFICTPLGTVIPGGWGGAADVPLWVAFAAVALFVFGSFFHFVADAQKYFVLRYQRPRQLITSGMFSLSRNPNYLGEVMMYAAFNLLAQHWLPWLCCALIWVMVFGTNMLAKERSMSRYPEHSAWVARTGLLLPSIPSLVAQLSYVVGDPEGSSNSPLSRPKEA